MEGLLSLIFLLLYRIVFIITAINSLSSEIVIDLPIYIISQNEEVRLQVRDKDDTQQVIKVFCKKYSLSESDCANVNTYLRRELMTKLKLTDTDADKKTEKICNDRRCTPNSGYKLLTSPTLSLQSDPLKYNISENLDSFNLLQNDSVKIVI